MGWWGGLASGIGKGLGWVGDGLNLIGLKKGGRVRKTVRPKKVGRPKKTTKKKK